MCIRDRLIRYDLDRDVALVALRSDVPLRPVSIAGPSRTLHVGERVFSIGCNRGQAASVMAGTIRAVNQYLGPDNVTVTGEPVDGRSGGGLFSADGRLIGVCNAADPESHEGLYAAFGTVHKELDAARLSFVYRRGDGQSLATVPSRESPSVPLAVAEPAGLPGPAGPLMSDDTEVICIIRPKNDPDGRAHVVVLDRPSREFVAQLQREHTHQDKRQTTDLRTDRFGRPQRR